jgi:hypothetical protein
MINLNYNKSDGAIVASQFKRTLTYSVPTGFSAYIIKFTSFQEEAAVSRIVTETNMGSMAVSTNTWTTGTQYTSPQFSCVVEGNVTTTIQSGAGNIVLTVTYTNEQGTGSRTGTITISRGAAVGTRAIMQFQSGDVGLRSIQSVSVTPAVTGVVSILGFLNLAVHQDQSTTTQTETIFAPGAITFPATTVLGIEYSGGTVSKNRDFDALIQLVQ